MEQILNAIKSCGVVPVVALKSPDDAAPLMRALDAGGISVIEITFRSEGADRAIRDAIKAVPGAIVGAGTVTRREEVEAAAEAGAHFAVAPGFNPRIVERAQEIGLPFFPGIASPSDIEAALDADCSILKFFPAGALGGAPMLKALAAPYRHRGVQFMPTGGVKEDNLAEYLAIPEVFAVGGTWLGPKGELDKDGLRMIEAAAARARAAVDSARKLAS